MAICICRGSQIEFNYAYLTKTIVYLYKILDKVYDIQYFIFQSLTNSFNKTMDFLILNSFK